MWVRGHWRSLKVIPFESLGTVLYSPSIVTMAVCLAFSEIFSVKRMAWPWKPTHSLTHCCAWPAEGRSVLHIERSWPAIQAAPTDRPVSSSNCCSQFLRGRPGGRFQSARSLKMAPFGRPYATFYWSAIVNIALSCTIFELFDVE